MNHRSKFLTAEWNNVLLLNYTVDASLLKPFVPAGTELDLFEGRTYLSVVGFEFNRLRIWGLAVPFHQSFEEVNLRFYVRQSSRRGVVFIREFVPKYAVAAVARFAFNESYSRVFMSRRIQTRGGGDVVEAEYAWGMGLDRCSMRIETDGASFLPPDGSLGQFITEHYWGYSAQSGGGCLEYEVQHPRWSVQNARRASFSGNATGFYGAGIARTLTREPDSAFLTRGSPVTVFKGGENPLMPIPCAKGWVLYDGDCAFCVRWLNLWRPVLRRHGFEIEMLQAGWVPEALGMTPDEALRDIRLLTASGTGTGPNYAGADVYLYVARRIWWVCPFGILFSLPGFNLLIWAGYRWFVANRYCVSGYCERRM